MSTYWDGFFDDRRDEWDDDPHAPGSGFRPYGSLRAPGVSRRDLYDAPDDPPERDERGLTAVELARTLDRLRLGRCTLRADQCFWPECVKHHPPADRSAT